MEHFVGHQQALVKDNVVTAVLVFEDHDDTVMNDTFTKFAYDTVVDLCVVHKNAYLDAIWDGNDFIAKPFQSWVLNSETLTWDPPVPAPKPKKGTEYRWDELALDWVVVDAPAQQQ